MEEMDYDALAAQLEAMALAESELASFGSTFQQPGGPSAIDISVSESDDTDDDTDEAAVHLEEALLAEFQVAEKSLDTLATTTQQNTTQKQSLSLTDLVAQGAITERAAQLTVQWLDKQVEKLIYYIKKTGQSSITYASLESLCQHRFEHFPGIVSAAVMNGVLSVNPSFDPVSPDPNAVVTLHRDRLDHETERTRKYTIEQLRMSTRSVKKRCFRRSQRGQRTRRIPPAGPSQAIAGNHLDEDLNVDLEGSLILGSLKERRPTSSSQRASFKAAAEARSKMHAEITARSPPLPDEDDDEHDSGVATLRDPLNVKAHEQQLYQTMGWEFLESSEHQQTLRTYRTLLWGTNEVSVDQVKMGSMTSRRSKDRPELDIDWMAFSLPELKNFLTILDAEEALQQSHITKRYRAKQLRLTQQIQSLGALQQQEQFMAGIVDAPSMSEEDVALRDKSSDSNARSRRHRASAISLKTRPDCLVRDRGATSSPPSDAWDDGTLKASDSVQLRERRGRHAVEAIVSSFYGDDVRTDASYMTRDNPDVDDTPLAAAAERSHAHEAALSAARWLDSQIRTLLASIKQAGVRDGSGNVLARQTSLKFLTRGKIESFENTLAAAEARQAVRRLQIADGEEAVVMLKDDVANADLSTYTVGQLRRSALTSASAHLAHVPGAAAYDDSSRDHEDDEISYV